MTRPGLYICGCDPADDRIRNYSQFLAPDGKNYTNKRYNSHGEEVCPIHGEPYYGSESTDRLKPPRRANLVSLTNIVRPSEMPDKRPHIYDSMLDDHAKAVIERVSGAKSNGQVVDSFNNFQSTYKPRPGWPT